MKLSVFVVTYNHEKFIRQCLDSILMQKVDFDYEIVIGEDSGTDQTLSICEEYAREYSQIKLLPKTNRLGIAGNWKRVLSECKGKYVAMCEGDDYWCDPLKLQKQVDFLESDKDENFVLCFHDVMLKDGEDNIIEESKTEGGIANSDRSSYDLITGYHPSTQTVMFRQKYLPEILSVIKKYKYNNNDAVLFSLLGQYGAGKFIPNVGKSVWRIHNGSAWSSASEINKQINIYNTYTFLQRVNKEYKNHYSKIRLSYASKILPKAVKDRKIAISVKYYFITCWLYLKLKDFKSIWNIQKGVIYNLIHK